MALLTLRRLYWHMALLTHGSTNTRGSTDTRLYWHTSLLTHRAVDTQLYWHPSLLTPSSIDTRLYWHPVRHPALLSPVSIDTWLYWHTTALTPGSIDTRLYWHPTLLTPDSTDTRLSVHEILSSEIQTRLSRLKWGYVEQFTPNSHPIHTDTRTYFYAQHNGADGTVLNQSRTPLATLSRTATNSYRRGWRCVEAAGRGPLPIRACSHTQR